MFRRGGKGHPVMLNRAPTLHKLSIQAFHPVLVEEGNTTPSFSLCSI